MSKVQGYNDPKDRGNSAKYHTGKLCIGLDGQKCEKPAGTWWSPYWCFGCNVKRIDRITASLEKIVEDLDRREARGTL